MGFEITEAKVTCDKCKAVETVNSNVLPDGWTRVRKSNNQQAILCKKDADALNAFLD